MLQQPFIELCCIDLVMTNFMIEIWEDRKLDIPTAVLQCINQLLFCLKWHGFIERAVESPCRDILQITDVFRDTEGPTIITRQAVFQPQSL